MPKRIEREATVSLVPLFISVLLLHSPEMGTKSHHQTTRFPHKPSPWLIVSRGVFLYELSHLSRTIWTGLAIGEADARSEIHLLLLVKGDGSWLVEYQEPIAYGRRNTNKIRSVRSAWLRPQIRCSRRQDRNRIHGQCVPNFYLKSRFIIFV